MTKQAAFVIGATGGLGHAACDALAKDWDGLAIGYRSSEEKANAVAAGLPHASETLAVHCDLADSASISQSITQARDHFGAIGTMIFASGVAIEQPFVSSISEDQWREVIDTELIGLTRVVAETLPIFREQGHGNFVIVVSVANTRFPPGDALSSVPKAGMEAIGRAIAKEEGKYGIRANMVAPGIIDAGLGTHFLETLYSPDVWESQKRSIALRRFGTGEDIAKAIAFLASDDANYITGQTLIVDGGFSL
ncbi:SDR family NAD(P)-dependent oxidoreductase [Parasphingorhabdus sp.]|uniref:SDR family NAD(P)-dependent oxidoreductase n=1 Tax=Parasphingorhabdus sp. TaxID=2709688 RepID=UPI003BAE62F5